MRQLTRMLLAVTGVAVGCGDDHEGASSHSAPRIAESADVVSIDPNDVLYTTPTLNDALPVTESTVAIPEDTVQLHADDWRQFEFIPRHRKPDVILEIEDITSIRELHGVPIGDSGMAFQEIHVRKRIPSPMDVEMSPAGFASLIGQETRSMAFFDDEGPLRNVYAANVGSMIIYAEIQGNTLAALGIEEIDDSALPGDFAERLRDFVTTHDLMLVHWPSRTVFATHNQVLEYFRIGGNQDNQPK